MSILSLMDLPVRNEFWLENDDYPIALGRGEWEVVRTIVTRVQSANGLPEHYLFSHTVRRA